MGLAEPGLNRLAREAFRLLGLISFFTVGEDECRAWPVRAGTPAVEAAGEIHSDIARGFIRAEVMSYEDLIARGSETAVREAGSSGSRERDTRSATATWSISGSMCDPRKSS